MLKNEPVTPKIGRGLVYLERAFQVPLSGRIEFAPLSFPFVEFERNYVEHARKGEAEKRGCAGNGGGFGTYVVFFGAIF